MEQLPCKIHHAKEGNLRVSSASRKKPKTFVSLSKTKCLKAKVVPAINKKWPTFSRLTNFYHDSIFRGIGMVWYSHSLARLLNECIYSNNIDQTVGGGIAYHIRAQHRRQSQKDKKRTAKPKNKRNVQLRSRCICIPFGLFGMFILLSLFATWCVNWKMGLLFYLRVLLLLFTLLYFTSQLISSGCPVLPPCPAEQQNKELLGKGTKTNVHN